MDIPIDQLEALRSYLLAFARSLLHDPESAQDAVQEAILRAWLRQESYDGRSTLRAWVGVILRNVCYDMSRDRRRRRQSPLESAQYYSLQDDYGLGCEELLCAVASVPPKNQEALLLQMAGRSEEETARALGIAKGTVKSRISRARAEIKRRQAGKASESAR